MHVSVMVVQVAIAVVTDEEIYHFALAHHARCLLVEVRQKPMDKFPKPIIEIHAAFLNARSNEPAMPILQRDLRIRKVPLGAE